MGFLKILTFHELTNVKWFENIIVYLKTNQNIISIEKLNDYNNHKLKNSYIITIDDGHKSFYNNVFPILKKYNVPVTLFVSPKICKHKINYWFQEIEGYNQIELINIISDIIKVPNAELNKYYLKSILKNLKISEIQEIIKRYQFKTNTHIKPFQNMTINNLIEVRNSNLVTIGAHTMNHPILANEDNEISKYEIQESIFELANILNQDIKYFAYPNGIPNLDFKNREMDYAKASGIKIAVSTEFKKASKNSHLMKMPRGEITNGKAGLKTKIYLWEYWNTLASLKSKQIKIKQRNDFAKFLKNKTNSFNE